MSRYDRFPGGAEALRNAGYYSAAETARLTGIPMHSIQNWCTAGFIEPSVNLGPGRNRGKWFSLRDVIGLRAIQNLRDRHISVQRLRQLGDALRQIKQQDKTLEALASSRLVVLKDRTVLLLDNLQLIDLITRQSVIVQLVAIELRPVIEEMKDRIAVLEAVRQAA
jgi:DNA-binding transcriptional MerR regulator